MSQLKVNIINERTLGKGVTVDGWQVSNPYNKIVNVLGNTGGGVIDIDLNLGNIITATVNSSTNTFTFSNPPEIGVSRSVTLILENGGSQVVIWPAGTKWAGGTKPELTVSGIDVITFITCNGGICWYGLVAGQQMR